MKVPCHFPERAVSDLSLFIALPLKVLYSAIKPPQTYEEAVKPNGSPIKLS